jgi:serine/threonine-protein kinase
MEKVKFSFVVKLVVIGMILSGISAAVVMKVIFAVSTITMPDFTGIRLETAQASASRMKIDLKVDDQVFSSLYENGCIMQQDIKKGTEIKKGRTVYVIVSKGSKLVTIPDITNQPKNAALVLLKNNDLNAGYETTIKSNVFKEDAIVAQSPAAGQDGPAGIYVNFLRASGKKDKSFLMPDLSGRDVFKAFQTIRKSNLLIEKLDVEINEGLKSGTIISQQPEGGYMITEKTPITLKASVQESDVKLKKHIIKISYANPAQVPQLVRITVLSLNGSETVYNEVAQPAEPININATIRGEAVVQIFHGTELVRETEISN